MTRTSRSAPTAGGAHRAARGAGHGLTQTPPGPARTPPGPHRVLAARAGPAGRLAARGLIQVLVGSDPAPVWRSPWQRRAAHCGLAVATLALSAASLTSITGITSRFLKPPLPGPGQRGSIVPQPSFVHVHPAAAAQVVAVSRLVPHAAAFRLSWLVGFSGGPGQLMALAVLVALAVVAPLPLLARYPLLGWRIGWLGLLLLPLAGVGWTGGWPWSPVQIVVLLAVFGAAGVRHPRAVLWWMWALTLIPWWLRAPGHPGLPTAVLGTIGLTAVTIALDAFSSRRGDRRALADQAEATELERARRAVLEERAKIARELHDVVAHHMSLIAVRAETAPYRLAGLDQPVREEFGSLSSAAREALTDMRKLLGVLRHDQPPDRAPQPQLSDLPGLIDTARRAGVAVRLSAPPAPGQVPAGVGVCAYRIVQESLSNAGRHAPGAAVTVSVNHDPGAVVLRVANGPGTGLNGHRDVPDHALAAAVTGPGAPAGPAAPAGRSRPGGPGPGLAPGKSPGHGPGHGLAGMRERVALLGGSLSAGPAPDGGFVVSAVLPLDQAA